MSASRPAVRAGAGLARAGVALLPSLVCGTLIAASWTPAVEVPLPEAEVPTVSISDETLARLESLASALEAGSIADWRAFGRLAGNPQNTGALVGYAPRILERDRAAFEEASGSAAYRALRIRAGDLHGKGAPGRPALSQDAVHFPIHFLHPVTHAANLGLDLGTDADAAVIMRAATRSGRTTLGAFPCPRSTVSSSCVLAVVPVREAPDISEGVRGLVFAIVPATVNPRPAVAADRRRGDRP